MLSELSRELEKAFENSHSYAKIFAVSVYQAEKEIFEFIKIRKQAIMGNFSASVITSYSIHYTKLYDDGRQINRMNKYVSPEYINAYSSNTGEKRSREKHTYSGKSILKLIGKNLGSRITSYNVCYTKLLRILES